MIGDQFMTIQSLLIDIQCTIDIIIYSLLPILRTRGTIHPSEFIDEFKRISDAGGGETGQRAPYGLGGYEIATQSAGLAKAALFDVLDGKCLNSYALSRPPGHHCTRDWQNGFCLLANIAIAVEAAFAAKKARKIAVLDWDVHHGNGTEAIFYDRADVLTISIHQDRNYPVDTGAFSDRGEGAGAGFNLNLPLPPGTGHKGYLDVMERLIIPQIQSFNPDAIVVACGFDAAAFDPLGRMLAGVDTFRAITKMLKTLANSICAGRLVLVHEGGYSETYVPFCGHAVVAELAESPIDAPDAFAELLRKRQPDAAFDAMVEAKINEWSQSLTS